MQKHKAFRLKAEGGRQIENLIEIKLIYLRFNFRSECLFNQS